MKVLFIDYNFLPAGENEGSASFYLLREYAKKTELEVDLLTVSPDQTYHLLKMGENVMIHQLPMGDKKNDGGNFAKSAYGFALELTGKNRYGLTHAFSSYPAGVAAELLNRKTKLPYVVSLEESDLNSVKNWLDKLAIFKVWKKACFLIADNFRLRNDFLAVNPPKEIEIISKGVDLDFFCPGADKQKNDQFLMLCDSELIPIKGIRFVIQAFKILSGRYDKLKLVIIGEGSEKQSLQNLVQGLEIIEKVSFLGNITNENRLQYYQQADLFVLASLDQEFDNGVNLRPALVSGLPIVATPARGAENLVIDGRNGFSVMINTADDLVEKIEKLILDENLKLSMGKNSLEIARELGWENIAGSYLDFYVKTKNVSQIQEG